MSFLRTVPLIVLLLGTNGWAQPPATRNDSTKGNPTRSAARPLTDADEQAALLFAKEHHPELHDLLQRLRSNNRGEFHQAIHQLHGTRERLDRLEDRTPERYAPTLALWKLDSRIRLLVARMTMSENNSGLQGQLDELLTERTQARLQLLKLDRERAEARLERLRQQIAEIESNPQAAAHKDLAALRRSLGLPADGNSSGKSRVKTKVQRPD